MVKAMLRITAILATRLPQRVIHVIPAIPACPVRPIICLLSYVLLHHRLPSRSLRSRVQPKLGQHGGDAALPAARANQRRARQIPRPQRSPRQRAVTTAEALDNRRTGPLVHASPPGTRMNPGSGNVLNTLLA
jgi:hypothetical protein